jgi:hypothetical protein
MGTDRVATCLHARAHLGASKGAYRAPVPQSQCWLCSTGEQAASCADELRMCSHGAHAGRWQIGDFAHTHKATGPRTRQYSAWYVYMACQQVLFCVRFIMSGPSTTPTHYVYAGHLYFHRYCQIIRLPNLCPIRGYAAAGFGSYVSAGPRVQYPTRSHYIS